MATEMKILYQLSKDSCFYCKATFVPQIGSQVRHENKTYKIAHVIYDLDKNEVKVRSGVYQAMIDSMVEARKAERARLW